jgi:hypothetical protein
MSDTPPIYQAKKLTLDGESVNHDWPCPKRAGPLALLQRGQHTGQNIVNMAAVHRQTIAQSRHIWLI